MNETNQKGEKESNETTETLPLATHSHQSYTLSDAQAYCRRVTRSHYENFTVASWLLPRRLRAHFYPIYAYCRGADDLADEGHTPDQSLRYLDAWEHQLRACYDPSGSSQITHPVFVALKPTVDELQIPAQPFLDLLVAFRRDQYQTRFPTAETMFDYCRYSANPVGRLVLYVGGCHDKSRGRLADSICTGLQLANFWQDVARDLDRGRIYVPQDICQEHGYDDTMLHRREYNNAFRIIMAAEVERAESCLIAGWPLVSQVTPELRVDVRLFIQGGLEVLRAIRRIQYNVWKQRPKVSRTTKAWLLVRAWWQQLSDRSD